MDKKTQIIESSIHVFIEYGFHGSPITKLIKNAKVSNGTFFYYFKTKEELITAIYVYIKEELHKEITTDVNPTSDVKTSLKNLWINWVSWGIDNYYKFRFLELFSNSPFIKQIERETMTDNYKFIGEILKKGIQQKLIADFDILLLNQLIYGSIRGTILYYHQSKAEKDLDTIFNKVYKSFSANSI